jgi:hypothetical protein
LRCAKKTGWCAEESRQALPAPPQTAAPLHDVLVAGMLAAAGSTLRDVRNKALLTLGYVTLCRRSELVVLLCEDLEIDSDGFGTVTIRRSKADQEGEGDVARIFKAMAGKAGLTAEEAARISGIPPALELRRTWSATVSGAARSFSPRPIVLRAIPVARDVAVIRIPRFWPLPPRAGAGTARSDPVRPP